MEGSGADTTAPTLSAALIRLARMKVGMTQAQLANRAGVSVSMISAYERGKRDATLGTLMKLVSAADLELRMRLEPRDDHDQSLEIRRKRMTADQRRRADARLEVWRNARERASAMGAPPQRERPEDPANDEQ
jgi:transcriptional regulator with XRE-family HTH domain